jgi:hypothetical protein
MGALAREGLVTIAGGPRPSANASAASASTVAAISFPDPPGTPVIPDPPRGLEPDGSEPTPTAGVPVRDRLLGAGVLLVLFAILAATAGWRVTRDDSATVSAAGRTETPSTQGSGTGSTSSTATPPDQWPAEVLPLVTFVEQHRGAPFDHPVPITYLTPEEYQAAAQAEAHTNDTTAEDAAKQDAGDGQLRALGLLDPSTNVQDAVGQLYGGGTLAYYDPQANEVKVLGTELDVAHRVTLVHELTHAWQDQRGYLDKLDDLDDGQAYALQSLAEGDATRIEYEYIDSLSSSEQAQYDRQTSQQGDAVDLGGVPDVLVASFGSLYAVGQPFVDVLDQQGGNAKVNAALADPPDSEADMLDVSRYLDGVSLIQVDEPSIPSGAQRLDGGQFGAVSWLLTLSEKVDPREALKIVDGWGGDQSVIYQQGNRVCTAVAYRGLTPADTATALTTIGQWAGAMPGFDASVERVDDNAVLRSCEPADGGVSPIGNGQVAVGYVALRLQAVAEVLRQGAPIDKAICFGDALISLVTPEQITSGAVNDPTQAAKLGDAAGRACR